MKLDNHKHQKKRVAPVQGKTTPKKYLQKNYSAIFSQSTSGEDQRSRVLELLRIADQTTYNLRAHGIAQCAARIFELRERGYVISKSIVNAVDSDGYMHVGVALYSLIEPAA